MRESEGTRSDIQLWGDEAWYEKSRREHIRISNRRCLNINNGNKGISYIYHNICEYWEGWMWIWEANAGWSSEGEKSDCGFLSSHLHQNFPHKPQSEHPWPRNVFLNILIFVSKICCCIFLFALFIISWSLSKSIIQESSQTQPKVFTLILRQTQPSSQAWHKLIHSNTINQISDIFLPKNS